MTSEEKNKLKTQQYLPRITLASRSERDVCVLYKSLSVYRGKKQTSEFIDAVVFSFIPSSCARYFFFLLFAIVVSYLLCYFIYSLTLFRRLREILYTSQDSRMVSSNDLCWIISVVYATWTVVYVYFVFLLLLCVFFCYIYFDYVSCCCAFPFWLCAWIFIRWRTNVTETL